ncbi:MAG TPA: hypothetical protein ENK88_08600 [Campylobacterales bacterium]|nr:hypothetical protein [Campylobacterales bacterium]
MKIYNVFIVAGPLHIMNSIEAIEYFKTKNNILLILYTDNKKQLNQMKKLLKFIDWHRIEYIPLPQKSIDKIIFSKNIYHSLKFIKKNKIDKLFVGEYRSDHVNHIVNSLKDEEVYLLDDGLAQIDYHKEMAWQPYRVKVRRLIYSFLLYKLNRIKYTFFTVFDIDNEKVIKNNYSFFKRYIDKKDITQSVYFIGQPLVELGIMSEDNYKNELTKIISFYGKKKFVYILHRRQDEKYIRKLSIKLKFEYREFENMIELEMINSKTVPSDFATFYSTAIVTLPQFIEESKYRVFRSQNRCFNKKFIDKILTSYKEFEKIGLRVELL